MTCELKTAVWGKEFFNKQNVTLAFRLKFNAKDGEQAIFTLSAKQLYKVVFNGEFIHYGPERTAHGYSKIDRLKLLTDSGENNLVVEVYQAGVLNYYLPFERAYFSANLSVGEKIFSSNDFECFYCDDRVQNSQRYCGQRTFVEDYVGYSRAEFYVGKDVYKKVETSLVNADRFIEKDCDYPLLKEFNEVNIIESGRVIERLKKRKYKLPCLLRDRKNGVKIDYEVITDKVNNFTFYLNDRVKSGGKYYLYEFEREISGFINFNLNVEEDAEIFLVFDEVLSPQKNKNGASRLRFDRLGCANIVRWKLKKGNYKLSTFEAYSFKFVKIIVNSGKISNFSISATRYENGAKDIFTCKIADKQLESIVVAAYNTFRQNSVDMLFDCPSRERAGWINDVWFSRECSYLFGGEEKPFKSLLRAYALAPNDLGLPKGMIPMCYPSDFRTGLFMVACALWYVCCLSEYKKAHGNDEIVEIGKQKILELFEYLKEFENEFGLLENLKGKIFVEWSKANTKSYVQGVNFPSNMLYVKALNMAGILFSDPKFIQKSENIKQQIINYSFNGEFFEDNAVRRRGKLVLLGHVTEVCQYYAFECGVADKQSFPKLYKTLAENFKPKVPVEKKYSSISRSNIIIGLLIREKLAVQNGEFERALEELKTIYLNMAERTATLWEHEREKASCNHGIAAFAGVCIIKSITGYSGVKDGVLYFNKINYKTDCDITFPCGKETVRVIVTNGKMCVKTKLQYKIV